MAINYVILALAAAQLFGLASPWPTTTSAPPRRPFGQPSIDNLEVVFPDPWRRDAQPATTQRPVTSVLPRGYDPGDFIQDEAEYQRLLDRLYEEAANSELHKQGNYISDELSDDEIMRMFGSQPTESSTPETPSREAGSTTEPAVEATTEQERQVCYICLDELSEKPKMRLECGHEMHSDCLEPWLKRVSQSAD